MISADTWVLPSSEQTQLETLLLKPFERVSEVQAAGTGPFVIVLDGLDECGNARTLENLMALVVQLALLPPVFQIFVASRPEYEVSDAWASSHPDLPTEDMDLIDQKTVLEDIVTYITGIVIKIPSRGSQSWPPTQEAIRECAFHCGGLFEIAKIRMRILEMTSGVPMEEAFRELVQDTKRGMATYTTEYLRILRKAYITPYNVTGVEAEDRELRKRKTLVMTRFRQVIGTVLGLKRGMDIYTLSKFIRLPVSGVLSVLRPIGSIVSALDKDEGNIRFFHATCPEFLSSQPPGFAEDKEFFFDKSDESSLFAYCLDTLITSLQPHALLPASVTPNGEGSIWHWADLAAELCYSIDFWYQHLAYVKADTILSELHGLKVFFEEHWVQWIQLHAVYIILRSRLYENLRGILRFWQWRQGGLLALMEQGVRDTRCRWAGSAMY